MQSEQTTRLATALAGRYAIEREIGSGAMATVYLAEDLKHTRKVAVKVLRPELAAAIGNQRFIREVEIAAGLSHPHVLALYDSGEAGDMLFYVMPWVRGESLRQRLNREKQLPIGEALALTKDVASALAFAHSNGVVHRDIKPENILIHEGEAMVADFGIALALHTLTDARLTGTGLLVGTPAYMSPEQAAGEPAVDARSDVYSLGCVLYEMLTGEVPHSGPTLPAVIARRLTTPAPSVRQLRREVPAFVERALAKALAVAPDGRFASAAEFAEALQESAVARPMAPCVAVLPFRNLSADPENEYFADGITEHVIAQLSRIGALKVISRTSVMHFKTRDQSLREIGAALEATTILEGSIRRAGERVRIVAQLIDVSTDQTLWAETYDRRLTDIFVIQTDVALHIAAALRAELSRDEAIRINREPTRDLEAYQLYLRGRHYHIRYTGDGLRKAIEYYEEAIRRDPDYAGAWAGLALAFGELGEMGLLGPAEAYPRAKAAAVRALQIDNELGEAHCAMAVLKYLSDFDWPEAEREFKRALELTPGSADTWDLYGRMCSAMERFDEAIAMQRRARELDPLAHRFDLATALLRAGQAHEALEIAERGIELDPHDARGHATVAWALALQGRPDEGLARMQTAVSLSPENTTWLAQCGQLHGIAGDTEAARDVLRQLEDLSRQRPVSPYHMAYVHTGLGDRDRAMDYLEQAYEARAGAVYGMKGSFLFRTLHSHPRFTALLRKMNLA